MGEDIWSALEREVKEECGCIPVLSHYISTHTQQEGKSLNVRHLFVVSELDGVIANKEPEKSKHIWVSLKEARKICKHPSTQEFLDDIDNFTNEVGWYLG
jgi:hypothetical protein